MQEQSYTVQEQALLHRETKGDTVRANIVVGGQTLPLEDKHCRRMEDTLSFGRYAAMRGRYAAVRGRYAAVKGRFAAKGIW